MNQQVNHSTNVKGCATNKSYNFKIAQGKAGKTQITYKNLCESCGASRRLIAFRSASGKRYLCRDCAGRQGK